MLHIIKRKLCQTNPYTNENNNHTITRITDFYRDRDLIINSKCYECSLQFANRKKKQSANDSSL